MKGRTNKKLKITTTIGEKELRLPRESNNKSEVN